METTPLYKGDAKKKLVNNISNNNNMKIRKLMMGLAATFIVAGLQSCTGARPENNDGHNLWLGDITVKSRPADIAVWKVESKLIDTQCSWC
jgi:hypothetical protein